VEALALIPDGSRNPDLGQAWILPASLAGDVHLDECVSGPEAFDNAPSLVFLGADQPVTIRAIAGKRDQDPSRQETPVDDREGVMGYRRPQVHGIGDLAGLVRPKRHRSKQVGSQGHETDAADHRVSTLPAHAARVTKCAALAGESGTRRSSHLPRTARARASYGCVHFCVPCLRPSPSAGLPTRRWRSSAIGSAASCSVSSAAEL
jgi:hypothetical protein